MMKRILSLLLITVLCLPLLTGCHGAKRMDAFEIPASFDTTKEYTITFWAKSDTNVRQTNIYKNVSFLLKMRKKSVLQNKQCMKTKNLY